MPAGVGRLGNNTAEEDDTVVALVIGITVMLGCVALRLGCSSYADRCLSGGEGHPSSHDFVTVYGPYTTTKER